MSDRIDWAELRRARTQAQSSTTSALAKMLGCTHREAAERIAQDLDLEYWDTARMVRQAPAFDRLSLARAQNLRAALLWAGNDDFSSLIAVVHDPLDEDLWTQLAHWAQAPVRYVLSTQEDIHALLNRHESEVSAVAAIHDDTPSDQPRASRLEELSLASVSEGASPAVKLVNSTLYDALRAGASDVHLESTPGGLAVKFRIDGLLDTIAEVEGRAVAEQAISRLKVLAELDIAERRVPQDGSFRVAAQGREIDLRVSIIPGVHGEDAVIRILDKQAMLASHGSLTLDALGFDASSVGVLRDLVRAAYGMMLVTGPTGSGKTTTLYAALSESHSGREKVVTIEDPVEYQLPGVLQIPVNEKKGLTFARGLRSILRHDPDTIMVGEIRDRETAEIAVQSALTGHMVLTTVHANNVFDVFGRFTHMGIDAYSLVSALNGIWAQRLVRLNCQHCRRAHRPSEADLRRFGPHWQTHAHAEWMRGLGCGECRGTGYRGRVAIAEVLKLDDELREAIVAREPIRTIKQLARDKGARTLAEAGMALAAAGRTSLEEVARVAMAA